MRPPTLPPPPEPVLVVGAGPAGATAARTLALCGVPVRLLDRARFPRNKPCGGAITARVLRRFPDLAGGLQRVATHPVCRLRLEGPDGESCLIESDEPAVLMIRRVEFDAMLVSLAEEAGAEVVSHADVVGARIDGDRIVLTARDGRRFETSTMIAADGVHSVVARRLGLNPGWSPAALALDMMEETPRGALRDLDPSTMWIAYGQAPPAGRNAAPPGDRMQSPEARGDGDEPRASVPDRRSGHSGTSRAPEGYVYVFPKRDHVNVGAGYLLSYFRERIDARPYDLQRGVVDRLRARGIVAGHSVRENFTPFLVPVGGPLSEPGRGRVLLAGDAGGFVNGLTAEGIYYAMVSGDHAARAIARSWPARDAGLAADYRRSVHREIGMELAESVLLREYFFGDRRRIARALASRSGGAVTKLILDVAIGRRSYQEVRRSFFLRSPWLAGRVLWGFLKDSRGAGGTPCR